MFKVKQTLVRVGDLPKKLTPKDKIEPLSFQKAKPKNEKPRVTWPMYFITPFGTEKC